MATTVTLLALTCCGGSAIIATLNTKSGSDKTGDTATVQETNAMTQTTKPGTMAQTKSDGIPGDGTWLVQTDVKPGKYKTTVPRKSVGCYWARLSGTSGEFDDIITNGTETAGAQVLVTVDPSDKAFETKRCGSWVRISD